jgi:multiple sugar transport system ATP-binding protein
MGEVQFNGITKRFGDVVAVEDSSFTIENGELLVLLGPSGCGKTTTLRMIAGLEYPTEGTIEIGGENVTNITPRHREIAMVFQDLALYPHKSVRQNMAFPLEMQSQDEQSIESAITDAADMLEIPELLDRNPSELSGGQQQRVALGRALVRQPEVFLMDEPLSSLDAKLRTTMRAEILSLHQKVGETMVYVTHDQEIAMTLGDRIAVMNEGKLQQIAAPTEIYKHPTNEFVAKFIGSPNMNLFDARITVQDGVSISTDDFTVQLSETAWNEHWAELDGEHVRVGIRPQDIHDPTFFPREYDAGEVVTGEVQIVEELGSVSDAHISVGDTDFIAQVQGDTELELDEEVDLVFDTTKLHIFDPQTGDRISAVGAKRREAEKQDAD